MNGPTSWLNPFVPVSKLDGSICLCLDMCQANKAIVRERHVIPKIEDIFSELHIAWVFSKIDLREGYHQIMLHGNSRDITSFATHKGVYRYKRLMYGVKSAFEQFRKIIEEILAGCEGTKNVGDDVIIWVTNQGHHDSRLDKVLDIIRKKGLKIKHKECIFSGSALTFAGHKVSANGISADPKTNDTVEKIKTPSSASEVKSFLGMTNYCHQYTRDYSTISAVISKEKSTICLEARTT